MILDGKEVNLLDLNDDALFSDDADRLLSYLLDEAKTIMEIIIRHPDSEYFQDLN